eukprot:TRINITY_DN349_c1_g2_i4.p2 TRINITY_DN349_c1_g2~~TRINITY_DN349_c1_g2_i4.p2  ORF type:complete len:194 (+),score=49.32 TRINITY_DN349_c1_g2_i4:638-1219(+)
MEQLQKGWRLGSLVARRSRELKSLKPQFKKTTIEKQIIKDERIETAVNVLKVIGEVTFPILNLCCDHGCWRSLLFKWPKGLPNIDAISWYLLSKPNMFYYHLTECEMLKIYKIEAPFFLNQSLYRLWEVIRQGHPGALGYYKKETETLLYEQMMVDVFDYVTNNYDNLKVLYIEKPTIQTYNNFQISVPFLPL